MSDPEWPENRRYGAAAIAILPSPAEYAKALPQAARMGLITAIETFDGWIASRQHADELRRRGLAEYGGRGLTVFGMQVRRALVESIN